MAIWNFIEPQFSKNENWGSHEKIDENLLWILYCIRCDLGIPMVIHGAYENRKSGYHPSGQAVDFHFISEDTLRTQYNNLIKYLKRKGWDKLIGLGVYPDWNSKGFHIDTRGSKARWGRINGYKYVSIDEAFKWED